MRTRPQVVVLVVALLHGAASAAEPPSTMSYQGVLRDAANTPLTGTFDMVFRFLDPQTFGSEILVDSHTGWYAVTVTNGLFNVTLGSAGTVTDGWGEGTYTSLADVFRDYGDVWMLITIGTETMIPAVKIQASAYALNSGSLGGKPASGFLDPSSTAQTKSGPLVVTGTFPHAVTGTNFSSGAIGALGSSASNAGVVGSGGPIGGYFTNTSGSQATIADGAEGVHAVGATTGGDFANSGGIHQAILATGETGVIAYGAPWGSAGHFEDDSNGVVDLGTGDIGVDVSGWPAGTFKTSNGAYIAEVGAGNWNSAGVFEAPGVFTDLASGGVWFGHGPAGFWSDGPKAFLQNHPTDPTRLIAYIALEGPEAGTYTRGSGSIRGREARIALDPTFALTTDPEIGLTAVVTPRRPRADLYVASISTRELVVRSGATSADGAAFDYVVNGLRIGFESKPTILPSDAYPSATVPSLEASEARLAARPEDVRGSSPLARLSAERARSGAGAPELAGARALIAGINSPEHARRARSAGSGRTASVTRPDGAKSAVEPSTASPSSVPYSLSMPVEMVVHPGDVLSYDPAVPGGLRLAEEAADPAVVGVVVGQAGGRFRGQAPIAPAGTIASCHADASYRPIAVGDLLAASLTPGMAMSVGAEARKGTVIGRALEPLPSGTGTIRILVMPR